MSQEKRTPQERLQIRLSRIEDFLDTLEGGVPEQDAMMITLSSTLAQCYQAMAELQLAETLGELRDYAAGIASFIDTPEFNQLLAMAGLGGDESSEDEDEDEDEDADEDADEEEDE